MNKKKQRNQAIIIITDQQRWDMINCFRDTGLHTPNLDKLAKQGIRFERAYCCQPVCGPARSAIFTGTYPHTNGSIGNSMPIYENIKTMGEALADENIKSAYIGKWHLDGSDYFGLGECPPGWDEKYWYDMRNYLDELSESERLISRDMKLMDKQEIKEEFTYGFRIVQKAKKFIEENEKNDYLLVISFDEPHHPCLCPNRYYDMYKKYTFPLDEAVYDDLLNKPFHHKLWSEKYPYEENREISISSQAYFACNSYVDYLIGKVIDTINKYADKALVIYTSDHGDSLKSHRLRGKGPAVYDSVTRVPLIIRKKNLIKENIINSNPASHIDIMPTILEYFSIPPYKIMEGKSMLSELYGGPTDNKEIFIEFNRHERDNDGFGGFQPLRAVFDGRFKLSINLLSQDELYDLIKDPDELDNLISEEDYADVRNTLHKKLLDWMNRTRDPFRGYCWELRPWVDEKIKPIWNGSRRQRESERYEPKLLDYDTGMPFIKEIDYKQ